jgi:putative NADH-flavin reductase
MTEISNAAGPSMNIPTAGQKHVVIVGATGMVGGYALRSALENPGIASVTTIGRRKLGISHPKLKEVLHRDFADCSALAETLAGQGAAIFCLHQSTTFPFWDQSANITGCSGVVPMTTQD